MSQRVQLCISPEDALNNEVVTKKAMAALGLTSADDVLVKIVKRSIDARQRNVKINLYVEVYQGDEKLTIDTIKDEDEFKLKNVSNSTPVHIIGTGPAGLFAAMQLIENGFKPILFERGKAIEDRKKDIADLNRDGKVNGNSNWCFGEGGAGTYTDGKLYTRSSKRGNVTKILNLLVLHGASSDILLDAHPHIGTDKLPAIIASIRKTILECGGEIHFNSTLTNLTINGNVLKGIEINNDLKIATEKLILATGHSARDVYHILHNAGVKLEAKPFAMGLRVEHPQALINQIQYHGNPNKLLPVAEYALVTQAQNRGVYSFCMCPGGIIVPAATAPNELVLNGMSNSKRSSEYANAGLVVELRLEDFMQGNDVFSGLNLQQSIEQACFVAGGETLAAPAQRLTDFCQRKASSTLPKTTYNLGTSSQSLQELLPNMITSRIREAVKTFETKMKGYNTNEALLLAVESRTSSPIKIPRNEQTFQHIQVEGLFPCGEGAGYAGGIVSSAIDGMNSANALLI